MLDELLSCRAHDSLLLLSAGGRAHAIKAHKVPEASRTSMGTPIAQVRPYRWMVSVFVLVY